MVELISYVDPVISGKWLEEQSARRVFCGDPAGMHIVYKRLLTHAIARMCSVTDAHAQSYGYCVETPFSESWIDPPMQNKTDDVYEHLS